MYVYTLEKKKKKEERKIEREHAEEEEGRKEGRKDERDKSYLCSRGVYTRCKQARPCAAARGRKCLVIKE